MWYREYIKVLSIFGGALTTCASLGYTTKWQNGTYYELNVPTGKVDSFLSTLETQLRQALPNKRLKSLAHDRHLNLVSQQYTLWPLTIQSWNCKNGVTVGVWSTSYHETKVVGDTIRSNTTD